jgi:hypothetical protein
MLAGMPLLLPALAASVAVAAIMRAWVAARLATGSGTAFALLVTVGGIAAVTLTPALGDLPADRPCELTRLTPIPLDQIVSVTNRGLNVLLFIPLGVIVGALPRSRAKAAVLAAAIAFPFAIELAQYAASELGRACQGIDVLDNLTGLGIGMLGAGLDVLFTRGHRERA